MVVSGDGEIVASGDGEMVVPGVGDTVSEVGPQAPNTTAKPESIINAINERTMIVLLKFDSLKIQLIIQTSG